MWLGNSTKFSLCSRDYLDIVYKFFFDKVAWLLNP